MLYYLLFGARVTTKNLHNFSASSILSANGKEWIYPLLTEDQLQLQNNI